MNAVDVANQLRSNFTCHLQFERRNWRPLAWWLFDVCATNAFVIWRAKQQNTSTHLREKFNRQLIDSLLMRGLDHRLEKRPKKRRCAWGAKHPEDCVSGAKDSKTLQQRRCLRSKQVKRAPLSEITNDSRPVQRAKRAGESIYGCNSCNVNLCAKKGCFQKYHAHLHSNLLWNAIWLLIVVP